MYLWICLASYVLKYLAKTLYLLFKFKLNLTYIYIDILLIFEIFVDFDDVGRSLKKAFEFTLSNILTN